MNNTSPIQGQLIIQNCAVSMDGGSKFLMAKDSSGKSISFELPQHGIPPNFKADLIPGRLHVNRKPIELRSEQEREILIQLSEAEIETKSEDDDVADMVKEIIDFVKSDRYVEIAKRIGE